MSAHYNPRLPTYVNTRFELRNAGGPSHQLIQLNHAIDPKSGYEQVIVAREIIHGRYVDADSFAFDELPDRLFKRMAKVDCEAILNEGLVRIETFAQDPSINAADLPDNADSPYILTVDGPNHAIGTPISIGRRALVFRAWLEPTAHLRSYRTGLSIDDPDGFVSCITRKLEQILSPAGSRVVRVLHAACFYQWSRIVGTRTQWRTGGDHPADLEDAKYFIKPGYGFHDAEFRLVWILDQDFEGHVDIQCPDLPQFCSALSDHVR